MKNSDYWERRFTQLENAQNKLGQEAFKEIEAQYREAMKQIEAQISTWYQRFAKNNGITLAEARQWLSGKDLKEFKWDVKDYIKYGEQNALTGEWIKELENASAKYHISKFEALKVHIRQNLESLFSKQGYVISDTLSKVYTSGYYHTAYEIQKGFRIGWDIAGVDKSKLEKILAKPWAADGYNFSDRIWRNKDKLISEVYKELSQNIMLGADPQRAINSLAKKMNTSKYNTGRLVMTEEAYFSSTAQKEAFKELNVEEFKVVATLDSHTSEICRQMDGKHFPMTDYQPGTTAPPFHVYCRSTTAPYFADMEGIGERFARDANGKTYEVSADMTYDEWKAKQDELHGEGAVDKVSKMGYNESADRKQWETYKDQTQESTAADYGTYKAANVKNEEKHVEPLEKSNLNTQNDGLALQSNEPIATTQEIKPSEYKKFESGDEVNDFFYYDGDERGLLAQKKSQHDQWLNSLTTEERNCIEDYTAAGYADINDYFRHRGTWTEINAERVQESAKYLDSAISRFNLKDNITVQRGVMEDALDELISQYGFDSKNYIGKIYHDEGYVSTTALYGNRVATCKSVLFEINVPAGIGRGAYVNKLAGINEDVEYEFLLKRGADYKISDVIEENDITIIKMVMNDE